jgi:hypothetical protein
MACRFSSGSVFPQVDLELNWTWVELTNIAADNQNQSVDSDLTVSTPGRESVDIRHTIQVTGRMACPSGRGKLLNLNNKVLDAVFGG